MAKATHTDDFSWTCLHDKISMNGYPDIDAAAEGATDHFTEAHAEDDLTPSFSYENTNPAPEPPAQPTAQEVWDDMPANKPLTKADIAPLMQSMGLIT